jgi:hypothetical protein
MLPHGSCEESFSGGNVPVLTEQGIGRESLLIDRAMEVSQSSPDSDVCLVYAP